MPGAEDPIVDDAEIDDGEELEEFADPDAGVDDADDGDEADGDVDPSAAGDGQGGSDEDSSQVATPSRGAARIAALSREAREAKERADRLEAEMRAFREQQAQARSTAEREAEARRLEMMSPDERIEHRLTQMERASNDRLARMEFNSADANDKAAFAALCAAKPQLQPLASAVEERLAAMRAAGTTAPRETIAKYLIGEQALNAAPRARARAERTAEANKSRQRTTPGASRSDVSRGSGRGLSEAAARAARLADVPI